MGSTFRKFSRPANNEAADSKAAERSSVVTRDPAVSAFKVLKSDANATMLKGNGWIVQSAISVPGDYACGERAAVFIVAYLPQTPVPASPSRTAAPAAADELCPMCDGSVRWVAKAGRVSEEEIESYQLLEGANLTADEAKLFARQPHLCSRHQGQRRPPFPLCLVTGTGGGGRRRVTHRAIVTEAFDCTLEEAWLRGHLDLRQLMAIGSRMVRALRVFHGSTGRVHSDVAPQNICLRDRYSPLTCALIDLDSMWKAHESVPDIIKGVEIGVEGSIDGPRRWAYASAAMHRSGDASRMTHARDDLEALGWVLLSLALSKRVSWVDMESRDDMWKEKMALLVEMGLSTTTATPSAAGSGTDMYAVDPLAPCDGGRSGAGCGKKRWMTLDPQTRGALRSYMKRVQELDAHDKLDDVPYSELSGLLSPDEGDGARRPAHDR